MSSVADTLSPEAAAAPWSDRNQRWLSERLTYWCERLEPPADESHGARDASKLPEETVDDFEPAAYRLGRLFGLSMFERELLILAAGIEINAALRAAVGRVQGSAPQPVRLSFPCALSLLPQPHWDALSPLGPLRHWLLAHFDTDDGFARATLRIDERVLHYVTGVAAFDDRLTGLAQFDERVEDQMSPELALDAARTIAGFRAPLVMIADAAQASRRRAGRDLAVAVFRQMGLRALRVDAAALTSSVADPRDLADIGRRIDREAALAGAGVVVMGEAEAAHGASTLRLIASLRSPVIVLGALTAAQVADLPERQVVRFSAPETATRPHHTLSPKVERAADRALQQFHVEPSLLDQALASVASMADDDVAETVLWDALRESARGGLDALATRIESRVTFDDLVLPPPVAAQLREIAGQLRHRRQVYEEWGLGDLHNRGLGIAALFAGETGTGKTLAAEAIANEVRLDLYRIDLASVVSKYIGETEKNLSRLFDAAERSGAVLLFDEADALFGKRSEVKDSHDRYANIEVAYLLQRVESYRGLAILTTNLRSALDRAFLRRIRFVVQFPFPDEAAREQIWRRQFLPRAPVAPIDYAALARLQLSGGHIRSVALNAAFRAATRGEAIGQTALIAAARAEFAKLERSFNASAAGGE